MHRGCFLLPSLLSLLILVTPSVVRAAPAKRRADTARAVVLNSLGDQTVQIVGGATRVECFRVSGAVPPRRRGRKPPPPAIDRLLITRVGREQGPAFAARLRVVLLDPRLYPDTHDRCLFEPGVAFRLWSGPRSVDVILCFHCDDALIVTHNERHQEVHRLFTGFTPLRPPLLALAREAFPDDPQIGVLGAPKR